MRTAQREIGLIVIEAPLIEHDDHGSSAFVIRMTAAASPRRNASVEAALITNIYGHVLVAVLAKLVLRGPIERNMAATAIGFELGVPKNEGPRHEDALE
ncbi:MAG: hypothetical protein ACKVQT_04960 [Burkholderiales bacterium]